MRSFAGFEMSVRWYYRRIRALCGKIHTAASFVHPANRAITNRFLSSPQMQFVEDLLAELHPSDDWNACWDWDDMFTEFQNYVKGREEQLEERLRKVKYYIDEANTLTSLIVDSGERPETVGMQLCLYDEAPYSPYT
ncbi:uncharacterized protein TRAVEDRAFT_113640 [Trametes versicolor FP-101664 SS1]|uniref:uncharacterized protein n=1 Tax=Trametes versicolor (strain FP-101664) TaxID=717944 RepID=UPI0004622A98|nr:uncharacterized protein TRAVEDRAFT_113640 [Trametes versicolor FP-101664 SS1]EIW63664.1 hypothetical protein TRAVEDRAFT_113640 [Trametes versicolor FP-101664 SS1]